MSLNGVGTDLMGIASFVEGGYKEPARRYHVLVTADDVKAKTMKRQYLRFATAGAVAGILQQPFFNGSLNVPQALYLVVPGLIFALSTIIADMLTEYDGTLKRRFIKEYALGALVLIVGMPSALFAGAASLEVISRVVTGNKHQLGGIGLPFFLAEVVSCFVWSAVLSVRMALMNPAKLFRIMQIALLSTIAIMLVANIIEIISKTLWQKSFLLPTISIAEAIGSALILAPGYNNYLGRSRTPISQP